MIDIHALARPFESWNSLYSHSKVISTTVTTIHVGAMFLGGGLAIAADRTTLRVAASRPEERARQLGEVADVHRPVLIGIVVLFITGIAMMLADLENFLTSPVFWTKIALVTLLLINGALLQRTESTLRRAAETDLAPDTTTAAAPVRWQQIRRFSVLSVVLWTATFLAGSILTNAA
jgi:small-conductance mechanosensitive channel